MNKNSRKVTSTLFFLLVLMTALLVFVDRTFSSFTEKAGDIDSRTPQEQLSSGFARADGNRSLYFPQDFGPHPEYQTEWWYYTGNLETEGQKHFGYQLTFFRRALVPEQESLKRGASLASDQIYMAHFAFTDTKSHQHYAFERFSRSAAGLAGARDVPFQVWLEDWQVLEVDENQYSLQAAAGDLQIDLLLQDSKGPVLHGNEGYSQKGPEPGNASYYFSQTRLESRGEVAISGITYPVSGLSWMDHEFSTSALSADQIGWDWYSIQLDDMHELMVFQIRRSDGSIDPYSSGTLIYPDGSTLQLSGDDFLIQSLGTWRSPESGAQYPSKWSIRVPQSGLELEVVPRIVSQELNLSYDYWEGAVTVFGLNDGNPVSGVGFVEMTGYSESMEGEF